jgi:hypothetical protein
MHIVVYLGRHRSACRPRWHLQNRPPLRGDPPLLFIQHSYTMHGTMHPTLHIDYPQIGGQAGPTSGPCSRDRLA